MRINEVIKPKAPTSSASPRLKPIGIAQHKHSKLNAIVNASRERSDNLPRRNKQIDHSQSRYRYKLFNA
jgi:hypothetical protein